ncbi:MAG: TlpA disulfide reductase family protein [Paracoccaceae bacterium]
MAVMIASGPEAKRPPHMALAVGFFGVMGAAFGGMMRKLLWLLYTGILLGANTGMAGVVDPALLTGDMQKLVIAEGQVLPDAGLVDMGDAARSLTEYRGKWMVVNFWATWCVPCRTEMPALDRLQAALPDVAVVAVAVGPNPVPAIKRFVDEAGVKSVVLLRDPESGLAHQIGVMGLPVTLIVSPDGTEVARLIGGAEWDSDGAKAVLAALMAK